MAKRLKPMRLDQAHGWYLVKRGIADRYGRQMSQMDWAIWTAELYLEQTLR